MCKGIKRTLSKFINLSLIILVCGSSLFFVPNCWADLIDSFKIKGISGQLLLNANNSVKAVHDKYLLINKHDIGFVVHKDKEAIRSALQPFGFFNAHIHVSQKVSGESWSFVFNVRKGPRVRIVASSIRLRGEGKKNPNLLKTLTQVKKHLAIGSPLRSALFDKDKSRLQKIAQTQGFLKAKYITDLVLINKQKNTATVTLWLDTRKQYYFGKITASSTPLNPLFIENMLAIKEGGKYLQKSITKTEQNLVKSKYFDVTTIFPKDRTIKTTKIPVKIKLKMQKRFRYQMGFGYGTASKLRLSAGMNVRWVNSNGDKFNVYSSWGRRFSQLNTQYLHPMDYSVHDFYTMDAAIYQIRYPNNGRALVNRFGPGVLFQRGKWTYAAKLYYLTERWKTTSTDIYVDGHILQPYASVEYLSTYPHRTMIKNGWSVKVVGDGSYKQVLSTVSYAKFVETLQWIKTLFSDYRIVFKEQFGSTWTRHFDNIPMSEQFFAGGDGYVLGTDYFSKGPGQYLAVINLALQRRIYRQFYIETFYDWANAFQNTNNYRENGAYSGGLGVVWRSSFGDLMVYWAKVHSKKGNPDAFGLTLTLEL